MCQWVVLARDLLNRSSNVILLDEFDKAPAVFHSAFYQMFDEGILVDKHYVADISKAIIIICTSNYKSREEIKKS
ncbi:AAA family ATPase [Bacillus halotolerans]|uniref:AAA family ATPase n=1 Tax=Bacillus halotolerans TaxID=260554 RepID=UPI002FC2B137